MHIHKSEEPALATRAKDLTSPETLPFPDGSLVEIDRTHPEIRLLNAQQEVVLIAKMGENGLVLQLNAFQLHFNALDSINFKGREINLQASENLSLTSGGNLQTSVAGDQQTVVNGDASHNARIQKITADLGNVEIKANDDVKLDGERVKLNCT